MKAVLVWAIAWSAFAYRARALRTKGPQPWRWGLAMGLLFLAASYSAHTSPSLNRLTPNLLDLTTHVFATASVGCVAFWLSHLVYRQPPRHLLLASVVASLTAALIQVGLWLIAPIHTENISHDAAPPGWQMPTSSLVFYGYVITILIPTAATSLRLAFSNDAYTMRSALMRGSLSVLGIGCIFSIAALAMHAAAMAAYLTGHSHAPVLVHAGDNLIPIAIVTVTLGTVLVAALPKHERRLGMRSTIRRLQPLHRRVVELHPSVKLPSTPKSPEGHLLTLCAEIHDGLDRTHVVLPGSASEPLSAIATALRTGEFSRGIPASTLLPRADSMEADKATLVRLAKAYKQAA